MQEKSCRASELAKIVLIALSYAQKKTLKELPIKRHLPFLPWVAFSLI